MSISVFDIFSIGIGPSSSHTLGPMRAARKYLLNLESSGILKNVEKIKIDLYGSLALTGKGHLTDVAVMLGLEGEIPEDIDPEAIKSLALAHENVAKFVGEQKPTKIIYVPGRLVSIVL